MFDRRVSCLAIGSQVLFHSLSFPWPGFHQNDPSTVEPSHRVREQRKPRSWAVAITPAARDEAFTTTTSGRQPFKSGQYRMTIEEVKIVTKCGHCHKVGHWHRECPDLHRGSVEKEQHYLQSEEATFCGMLEIEKERSSPMNIRGDQHPPEEELSGPGDCEVDPSLSKRTVLQTVVAGNANMARDWILPRFPRGSHQPGIWIDQNLERNSSPSHLPHV